MPACSVLPARSNKCWWWHNFQQSGIPPVTIDPSGVFARRDCRPHPRYHTSNRRRATTKYWVVWVVMTTTTCWPREVCGVGVLPLLRTWRLLLLPPVVWCNTNLRNTEHWHRGREKYSVVASTPLRRERLPPRHPRRRSWSSSYRRTPFCFVLFRFDSFFLLLKIMSRGFTIFQWISWAYPSCTWIITMTQHHGGLSTMDRQKSAMGNSQYSDAALPHSYPIPQYLTWVCVKYSTTYNR